ncbi:MAG: Trk system potassium transport protein TrkA, partial [Gammaproteobacteria bacterium]
MKIIILGAGQVGSSVAGILAGEANDISVVDLDGERLRRLRDRLDIHTVQGHAAHPEVLRQAGGEDAELLLAVTSSDETNMLACRFAASLFHTPTRMARVRDPGYLDDPRLFAPEVVPVDVLISPEQEITDQIIQLLEHPGALQVVEFADGQVLLVIFRLRGDGLLAGHRIDELPGLLPQVEVRITALYRGDTVLLPDGDTVLQEGDELFALGGAGHIQRLLSARGGDGEQGPR